MIIRQLKASQYDRLHDALRQKAHAEPLDASYTVSLTVGGEEYAVRLQPEAHNKIAVLQALHISRTDDAPDFHLITQNNLLSAFLELLIYQGLPC